MLSFIHEYFVELLLIIHTYIFIVWFKDYFLNNIYDYNIILSISTVIIKSCCKA